MTTKIALRASKQVRGMLSLHPQMAESLGIAGDTTMLLRYGALSEKIHVTLSSGAVGENEAALSRETIASLRIPLFSRYEIAVNEQEIRLGPYIGFLVSHSMKNMKEHLHKLDEYLALYEQVGGTVIAFALSGVNTRRQTIRGYVFHPQTKRWIIGTYSYPAALFIKIGMLPVRYRDHFQSIMGDTVFNNFNYHKWKMHQLLQSSGLGNYLPVSQLYRKSGDLLHFLQHHQQAYVKPIRGSQGKSIWKIVRLNQGYLVRSRVEGNNRKHFIATDQLFSTFVRKRLRPQTCMMQKAIRLFSANNRIFDFRVIMVKNQAGKWEDMGLITRYGKPGSIVSNIKAGGSAETGERTLRQTFGLTEHKANRMRKKLSLLAHRVARSLDAAGIHCGNMGVDIGMDTERNVWIIEIQHNNPDHTLALDANERGLYQAILRNHLLYMKWLAGFGRQAER
ncbi:YheC/YheD family endospore coat-associated protein [Brevibacillus fluminis]|uniref:YheC/YheD family endospore coat-associated protein n=1 Tax=Brevibacillus fluminis TaxID=511487 RepID=UPI003F89F7AD